MKLTRFEAICLFLFVWLLVSSCGALTKVFSKEKSERSSLSISEVSTTLNKEITIDSNKIRVITDSSVVEEEYERTVVAEDYFVVIDSFALPGGQVIRKTTTTEKGKRKEQKAVNDLQESDHSTEAKEQEKRDTTGTTKTDQKDLSIKENINREAWNLFSIETFIWILFLLLFAFVVRKYIWPGIKEMFPKS